MGITSALYSGVSGLNTNSQAMSVIGNNLANTNTVGFKGSRTIFSDLLSSTVFGSGGASQVGRGVGMSKVDSIFSQGTFESTESDTDLAIEGNGFFMLKEPGNNTTYYSRAGAFRFNEDGFLVNPEGFRVQGKGFDANGELLAGDPGDIRVESVGLVPANVTDTITITSNLDASTVPIAPAILFDPVDPATYDYASSTQTYDTLGNPHLVTTYFRKDPIVSPPTWNWYWSAEDTAGLPLGSAAGDPPEGQIVFTADGKLDTTIVGNGTGAIAAADLAWDNGSTDTGITLTFDTTQFNNASKVISQNQNGYSSGNLTNVNINNDGIVIASYSNGQQTKIANITLAKFTNPNGLDLVGSNLFLASDTSGVPRVGLPGPELGKVFTNSLEQSNVDMGKEFVNMITVQRGFQANSKIITTVDELLGELINLKR
ncbi:MAG: flagellar hook protein FlgE [Proteobacteria bacterium]|nr:flagellar hook protein FlgE [Pseudomonadota bacterium]MBU1649773.1 flagellar hook protein FlgE [Pseudomonadota bacterium]